MKLELTSLVVSAVALCFEAGCAGAQYAYEAKSAKYPISLSPALPDEKGTILYLDHELERRGTFRIETSKFSFIYGSTEGTLDISEELNREVESRRGEGIVALSLSNTGCAINYFIPFTLLPFWPGCQDVTITGTVVRVVRAQRSRPPVPSSEGRAASAKNSAREGQHQ